MTTPLFTTDTPSLTQEQLNQQLAVAVYNNHHDGVRRLVEAGANVNAMHQNEPLLHYAATHSPRVVDLLLSLGADVNQPNESGQTLLGKAIGPGEAALRHARYWLERGANPRHDGNRFGLHNAAFHGDMAMVELLLKHGANAAQRNGKGQTPEDIAAQRSGPTAQAVSERLHRARIEQERTALHQVLTDGTTDDQPLPPAGRFRL